MCQDLFQQMALKLFQDTRFAVVPRIFCFNLNMEPCVPCCSIARLCVYVLNFLSFNNGCLLKIVIFNYF